MSNGFSTAERLHAVHLFPITNTALCRLARNLSYRQFQTYGRIVALCGGLLSLFFQRKEVLLSFFINDSMVTVKIPYINRRYCHSLMNNILAHYQEIRQKMTMETKSTSTDLAMLK